MKNIHIRAHAKITAFLAFFLGALLLPAMIYAAGPCLGNNFFWISNAPSNWTTAANWSNTSGGTACTNIPFSTATVVFDGKGVGNCTLPAANLAVSSMTISTSVTGGYTGIVATSGGFSLTISSSFYQNHGTFSVGTSSITVKGSWQENSNATFSVGTSTIVFNATSAGQRITNGGQPFYNLQFNGAGGTWVMQDSMTVISTMTLTAGTLNSNNLGISVGGSWWNTGGIFTQTTSTVTFTATGTGMSVKSRGSRFNRVNFGSGGSGGYWTLIDSMTVSTVTITALNSFELAGSSISVSSFTNAGTFILKGIEAVRTAPFGIAGSTITFNATNGAPVVFSTWTYRNLVINGSGATFTSTGTTVVNENLTLTAGTLDMTANNYAMTISSNWINNGGTFTARQSTVTFNSTSAQTIKSNGNTFANMVFSGSGGYWTLLDPLTTLSTMTFTNGTLDTSASNCSGGSCNVSVGGSWYIAGGTFTAKTSTVTFTATTAQNIRSGGENFYNLQINGSFGGSFVMQDSMTVVSTMTLSGGTLNANNLGISVGGSWWNTGGVFTQTTSTVTFTAASTGMSVKSRGSRFNRVNFGSGGTGGYWTLIDSMTVSTVTITANNSFDVGGSSLSISSFTNFGNFQLMGIEAVRSAPLGIAGSTITYDATSGAPVVFSTWTYRNLVINGPGGLFTSTGTTVVQENLTLAAGTLDMTANNYAMTISSDWVNTGGTFIPRQSTVTFNSTAAQTIQSNKNNFANVVFSGTGGYWTLQDSMTVVSTMTLTKGTLDTNATSNWGISVAGGWQNNGGTFVANQSTVTLTGLVPQIINNAGQAFGVLIDSNTTSGGVTFASSFTATSLAINGAGLAHATTVYFNAGSTFTITNLTLVGAAGNSVYIRPLPAGQTWLLNNTSFNNVSYVDVAYSSASDGVPIVADFNSINSGNNVNWIFPACGALTSVQTGNWSNGATWSGGFVPTSCNAITITAGTTVYIDNNAAKASTTTVNGNLYFNRNGDNEFMLVGGSMSVNSGGTLDMGTDPNLGGSLIPQGTTAYLTLAYGGFAGQYGLVINSGGNFSVYGSIKTPSTLYNGSGNITPATNNISVVDATGWQSGDIITIDTETVTITSPPSGNSFNITSPALTHYSTNTILVNMITHNVVVRSSGTTVTSPSYIENLVKNTTSFNLNYGEFAYLGLTSAIQDGIDFESASGTISSCTIHNGYFGVSLNSSSGNTLTANNIYANNQQGIYFNNSSNNTLSANNSYGNGNYGIELYGTSNNNTLTANSCFNDTFTGIILWTGSKNTLNANSSYRNTQMGIYLYQTSNNTLTGNNGYSNGQTGFRLYTASNNTLTSNNAYSNSINGFGLSNAANNNIFISNYAYGNTLQGVWASVASLPNTWAGGAVGYSSTSVASPNGSSEITLDPSSTADSLILKNTSINPTVGISSGSFNKTSMYLISYNQDLDTGSVRIWGDYSVSGSTFTLDYSTYLYVSQATNLKVMKGSELASNFTINWISDAYAVSQLVTIQYDGSNWVVSGSSTPWTVSIAPGNTASWPSSNPQVNLTVGAAAATTGDRADFALIAASGDVNKQKKLKLGPAQSAFNNGKSRIVINTNGGFVLNGSAANSVPALMDWLGTAPGATYYTFVDSGAFTANYSTITHTDSNGIWLNGNSGINMSSVTFDLAGMTSSSATYITTNILTSTQTFSGLTFNNSGSLSHLFNITVAGSEASLSWLMQNYAGPQAGQTFTLNDPLNKIVWGQTNACQAVTSNLTGNWSNPLTWNSGFVPTSCNAVTIAAGMTVTIDTNSAVASTTTVNGTLTFNRSGDNEFMLVGGSMSVNSGGTLDMGTSGSPIPQGTTAQLTLAYGTAAGQYGLVINPGGNFLVYGAAKTPWSTATGNVGSGVTSFSVADATGWQAGDMLTIDTEAVTILSGGISGNTISNYSPGLLHVHYSSMQVVVANLTRNVVVRSSGTNYNTNSSYLENQVTNAANFNVNYGEFDYIGAFGTGKNGIDFESAKGSISSSTVRYASYGIYLNNSSNSNLTANNLYANNQAGIYLSGSSNNTLTANNSYGNTNNGIYLQLSSKNNTLTANNVYSNTSFALYLQNSNSNILAANNAYANSSLGIYIAASSNNTLTANNSYSNVTGFELVSNANNNVLVSNNSYNNGTYGIDLDGASNNTLIADSIYGNSNTGIYNHNNTGNFCIACNIGYTSSTVASADTTADIDFGSNLQGALTLKASLINPSPGIRTSDFAGAKVYLLNYSTTTGVLQLYGDYQLSGSTLTLDYASELYTSTATAPIVMVGAEAASAFVVSALNDSNVVSQLITITYNGNWIVTGSSTSGTLCTIAGGANADCGTPVQFHLAVPAGLATGDIANFALIAASKDSGYQKQLQFGPTTGSGFNNDRSKLEINTTGGFQLTSTNGNPPSLMDWLGSGATYYTFVDSGALTLAYATINHTDERGLQLTGSAGVTMASSTFDLAGSGAGSSTSTYISAFSLTSNTTFYGMVFNNSSAVATYNYNVWASTEANLFWYFSGWSGARGGNSFDKEDGSLNNVVWAGVVSTNGNVWWRSGTTGTWSTNTNWSVAGSGGVSCGCTPSSASSVIFDGGGVGSCNIDQTVAVSSVTINSAYTGTINTQSNTVTISTNFVQNAGTFSAGSSSITIGGNWTEASGGTFVANQSTVAFTGLSAQTINNNGQAFAILIDSNTSSGGVIFASSFTATKLSVNGSGLASATTIYFNANSTFTITGLSLNGTSGKPVWMRSTTPTQSWYLNNTSTNTVSFVDVQDSSASAGVTIVAGPNSIDSGNNLNWTFLILSVSLSSHTYDFGTVNLAGTTVSTVAVIVTNAGNGTETYSLSVATTGAQTVWAVKVATPTVYDQFALFGLFNSVQPSSSTFVLNDIVVKTPTSADASVYAGNETGLSTAVGSARHMWMMLFMPLTTSTTTQQQMNLTVTASSP